MRDRTLNKKESIGTSLLGFWLLWSHHLVFFFFFNAKNKKKLKKDMNNFEFSFIWTTTIDRYKLYKALVLITIQVKKLQSSLS